MDEQTIRLLMSFLQALVHNSHEHSEKLRALERVTREHPEIFSEYGNYLAEIQTSPAVQHAHEATAEALGKLRLALGQE